ncbi:MAG TPA: immunoglobulin domain-containing protein [Verrucomicrobiae bacterium]
MQTQTKTMAQGETKACSRINPAPYSMRACLALALVLVMACMHVQAGVTVITHGFKSTLDPSGFPAWVGTMAQAVTNAAFQRGANSSWYHIRIHGDILFGFDGTMSRVSDATAAGTPEVVVTVDWSDISDNTELLEGAALRTDYVAQWIAGGLLATYPSAGVNEPLATRSIHLIGHSRGASAMLETARLLGASGIWVDHLTTLDPHPLAFPDLGILPGSGDPVAKLYENTVFADNYWRTDNLPSPLDFNGQEVPGAENVRLAESVLSGVGYSSEHSDVHAWYHGTIGAGSSFPLTDDEVSITDAWYVSPNPRRNLSGFFFSRLISGGIHYRPAFSYAIGTRFGGRHVRETTSRDGGAQWANVGFIQLPPYPQNRLPQGQPLNVTYKYQDRDSGVRVEWFLDTDTNPLNNSGSPVAVQTFDSTGDKVASGSVVIPTSGLNVGITRHLCAKITSLNNNAVRYEYADGTFSITWPEFTLDSVSPAQVVAGVGTTRLTLTGGGFTSTDKVEFDNGTTVNEATPFSLTASQMTVDFNFGSTLRTWNVFVRQFAAGLPLRDSESLPVAVQSATPTGPTIATQPADASVTYGQTATFTVAATGSGTLSYQWQRNGLDILAATNASYTTSPVTFANDGFTYRALATDAKGTTASRTATLNVVASTGGCTDAMEPNDSSLTATPLTLGNTTNGFICSASDVDWFRVNFASNGTLNLALTVPDGVDYDLELYGPDGNWLVGSYSAAGQPESVQQTVAPGSYFFRVYGYPAGHGTYSQSQPYQLSVSAAPIRPPGPVSGQITNAVMWSGVVELTGDVTIVGGASLTILPGTQVRCAGGDDRSSGNDNSRVEIIVNGGTLEASGTPEAPIRFTSNLQNPQPGNWYGIRVVEGDVTLRHCVVENGVEGIRFEDTDTRFNSYTLENSTVQRCNGNGVTVSGGSYVVPVVLSNFQLLNNSGAGLYAQGAAEFRGGRVEGNSGNGLYAYGSSALVVTGAMVKLNGGGVNASEGATVTLTDSVMSFNRGSGVNGSRSALQMSGCTVARNDSWGVYWYSDGGTRAAEVWTSVIQSNASGGVSLNYGLMVGVVSNTISDNGPTGLQLNLSYNSWSGYNGGVSASGITGNVIRRQDVGLRISGDRPTLLTLSGNDIYQNTSFELINETVIPITATHCYWGEPTSTQVQQSQVNLSRIYDQKDNSSYGLVTVVPARFVPIGQVSGTAPTITQQPQSQTVLAGSTVTYTVAATGTTPFSYQWRKNGNPVSGAISSTLALLSVQVGDSGTYSVIVSNSAGTATSSNATLTVTAVPANLAVRTITRTGDVFTVALGVSPPAGAGIGFVQEVLPVGFTATSVNAGGIYNAVAGTILWGPLAENQLHQLAYTLLPPPGYKDTTTLNGMAYFYGKGNPVTGDNVVSLAPPDPRARLTLTRVAGFFAVSVAGEVGRSYRIEARDSVNSGQWETLATITLTASPRVYVDVDSVWESRRFYRAILVE